MINNNMSTEFEVIDYGLNVFSSPNFDFAIHELLSIIIEKLNFIQKNILFLIL